MKSKMRYCWFCGEELGPIADPHPLATCGKRECEREAIRAERDEERANEQIERDRRGF
jgi:hypothetical protein